MMADVKKTILDLYGQVDVNREYWGDQIHEMLLKILEEVERGDG